jgi:hypothetical protein
MLLTEKQAAATWCPRTRARALEHMGKRTGAGGIGPEWYSCIGSKCMAWRWKSDQDPDLPFDSTRTMFVPTSEKWECAECKGAGCAECEGLGKGFKQAPVGYCGLAGHVEVRP